MAQEGVTSEVVCVYQLRTACKMDLNVNARKKEIKLSKLARSLYNSVTDMEGKMPPPTLLLPAVHCRQVAFQHNTS